MLICYTKAASEEEQLQKAGSLSTSSTAAVGARVTAMVGAVKSAVKSAVATNKGGAGTGATTTPVATRRVSFTADSRHVLQRKESAV